MKKLLQRVFGIAVSAALLITSGMTAFAAGHEHHEDDTPLDSPTDGYTITLTTPSGYVTPENMNQKKFGAYQIFSGTVKGDTYESPGDKYEEIPITDIKWGNAFGTGEDAQKNIIKFVFALAEAPTGSYSYAFSEFTGFKDFVTDGKLSTEYLNDSTAEITVAKGTEDKGNAIDGNYSVNGDLAKVNFDKLAVKVSDVIADNHNNREWLQSLTDILGGYGTNYQEGNFVSQCYGKENNLAPDGETYKYEIKVPAGYYMIMDLSTIEDSSGTDNSDAYSARMLFVANDITQKIKESVPTLDKKVLRADDAVGTAGKETDVAGVGDVVHFQLKGTLPSNYDNYLGGYQYTFIDTLSKGLDLVQYADNYADYGTDANNCVNVTVKGLFKWNASASGGTDDWEWVDETITLDNELISITSPAGATSSDHHLGTDVDKANYNYKATYVKETHLLNVYFPCLREIRIKGSDGTVYRLGYKSDTESSEIFLDYYAKVNSNAVVSPKDGTNDNGNFNTAQIQYSDNPQAYGDTDYTTTDRATVYTFGLDITKVDAAEFLRKGGKEGAELKDVQFMLARPLATTLDSDGKTKDDTEWEVATLTLITKDEIDSMTPATTVESFKENGYYSIVSWNKVTEMGATFDPTWVTDAKEVVDSIDGVIIKTVDKGILNISGLDVEVLYSLAEVKAPEVAEVEYAKIAPFTFKLSAELGDDGEYTGKLSGATSDQKIETGKSFSFDKPVDITDKFGADEDGSAEMLVANFKYIDLPSTGGVGTIWFYIFGVAGIALSGVLFFLSKKKVTR